MYQHSRTTFQKNKVRSVTNMYNINFSKSKAGSFSMNNKKKCDITLKLSCKVETIEIIQYFRITRNVDFTRYTFRPPH